MLLPRPSARAGGELKVRLREIARTGTSEPDDVAARDPSPSLHDSSSPLGIRLKPRKATVREQHSARKLIPGSGPHDRLDSKRCAPPVPTSNPRRPLLSRKVGISVTYLYPPISPVGFGTIWARSYRKYPGDATSVCTPPLVSPGYFRSTLRGFTALNENAVFPIHSDARSLPFATDVLRRRRLY